MLILTWTLPKAHNQCNLLVYGKPAVRLDTSILARPLTKCTHKVEASYDTLTRDKKDREWAPTKLGEEERGKIGPPVLRQFGGRSASPIGP